MVATKDVGAHTINSTGVKLLLLWYIIQLEGREEQIARVNGRGWARPPFSLLCREARLIA
jgi:hypothetical protein